jgi:mRNA interferase RelE/StbE
MSGRYAVEVQPAARKRINDIDPQSRARILRRIAGLENDPRPPGVLKLAGLDDLWRIRVGDYRVVYAIYDERLLVTVVRVGHRREIYRP